MNKNQVTGRAEEAKGAVKEAAGKLVGNKSLEGKGAAEKTAGKAEAGLGDAKAKAGDLAKKAIDR